jgi:hypothetical protein
MHSARLGPNHNFHPTRSSSSKQSNAQQISKRAEFRFKLGKLNDQGVVIRHSPTQIQCLACGVTSNGDVDYYNHASGRKHMIHKAAFLKKLANSDTRSQAAPSISRNNSSTNLNNSQNSKTGTSRSSSRTDFFSCNERQWDSLEDLSIPEQLCFVKISAKSPMFRCLFCDLTLSESDLKGHLGSEFHLHSLKSKTLESDLKSFTTPLVVRPKANGKVRSDSGETDDTVMILNDSSKDRRQGPVIKGELADSLEVHNTILLQNNDFLSVKANDLIASPKQAERLSLFLNEVENVTFYVTNQWITSSLPLMNSFIVNDIMNKNQWYQNMHVSLNRVGNMAKGIFTREQENIHLILIVRFFPPDDDFNGLGSLLNRVWTENEDCDSGKNQFFIDPTTQSYIFENAFKSDRRIVVTLTTNMIPHLNTGSAYKQYTLCKLITFS